MLTVLQVSPLLWVLVFSGLRDILFCFQLGGFLAACFQLLKVKGWYLIFIVTWTCSHWNPQSTLYSMPWDPESSSHPLPFFKKKSELVKNSEKLKSLHTVNCVILDDIHGKCCIAFTVGFCYGPVELTTTLVIWKQLLTGRISNVLSVWQLALNPWFCSQHLLFLLYTLIHSPGPLSFPILLPCFFTCCFPYNRASLSYSLLFQVPPWDQLL